MAAPLLPFLRVHSSTSAQTPRRPVNSLGMKFVEVPGTDILISIWGNMGVDFSIFAAENPGLKNSWMWEGQLDRPGLSG